MTEESDDGVGRANGNDRPRWPGASLTFQTYTGEDALIRLRALALTILNPSPKPRWVRSGGTSHVTRDVATELLQRIDRGDDMNDIGRWFLAKVREAKGKDT